MNDIVNTHNNSTFRRTIFCFVYCIILLLPGYAISMGFDREIFEPVRIVFFIGSVTLLYVFLRLLPWVFFASVLIVNVFFNLANVLHFLQYENRLKTGSLIGLYFTNPSEASEFYYILSLESLLIVLVYLSLVFILTLLAIIYFPRKRSWPYRNYLGIFVILALLNVFFQKYDRYSFFHYVYVHYKHFKLEYDIANAFVFRKKMYEERKTQNVIKNEEHATKNTPAPAPVHVIVLGESLSRAHMGIYGYKRQTTPFMQKRKKDLNIITNAVSPANMTEFSIPIMLSPVKVENNNDFLTSTSLIMDMRLKGYETWWITNQPKPVRKNTLLSLLINDAEHSVYIREEPSLGTYDENIVKELDKILQKDRDPSVPLFIILHMNGSHAQYTKRVPRDRIFFRPQPQDIVRYTYENKNVITNAYDNTVIYADYILEEIMKRLEMIDKAVSLFFFSDHGDMVFARDQERVLHGYSDPYKEEYEVPYFYWRNAVNKCRITIPQHYKQTTIHLSYFYEMFSFLTCQTLKLPDVLHEDKVLALGRPILYKGVR